MIMLTGSMCINQTSDKSSSKFLDEISVYYDLVTFVNSVDCVER